MPCSSKGLGRFFEVLQIFHDILIYFVYCEIQPYLICNFFLLFQWTIKKSSLKAVIPYQGKNWLLFFSFQYEFSTILEYNITAFLSQDFVE